MPLLRETIRSGPQKVTTFSSVGMDGNRRGYEVTYCSCVLPSVTVPIVLVTPLGNAVRGCQREQVGCGALCHPVGLDEDAEVPKESAQLALRELELAAVLLAASGDDLMPLVDECLPCARRSVIVVGVVYIEVDGLCAGHGFDDVGVAGGGI